MDMKIMYTQAGYPPPRGHHRAHARWLKRVQMALSVAGWTHDTLEGTASYIRYCHAQRRMNQSDARRK